MAHPRRIWIAVVLSGCIPVASPQPPQPQPQPAATGQAQAAQPAQPAAPRVVSEESGSHVVTGYNEAERELVQAEGIDADAPWHALAARKAVATTKQLVADAKQRGAWVSGLRYQTANDGTLSEDELLRRLDALGAKIDRLWEHTRPRAHNAWRTAYGATSAEAIAKLEELGKPARVDRRKGNTCWGYDTDGGPETWCWTPGGKLADHLAPAQDETVSVEARPADDSTAAPAQDPPAPEHHSGSYKKVSIFNGQANCAGGQWAQEKAVILDSDGFYKECDIFNGQCNAPGGWYQGKAVIKDSDGSYKECDIFNGKCDAPGSWYQGDAVIWCDDD